MLSLYHVPSSVLDPRVCTGRGQDGDTHQWNRKKSLSFWSVFTGLGSSVDLGGGKGWSGDQWGWRRESPGISWVMVVLDQTICRCPEPSICKAYGCPLGKANKHKHLVNLRSLQFSRGNRPHAQEKWPVCKVRRVAVCSKLWGRESSLWLRVWEEFWERDAPDWVE